MTHLDHFIHATRNTWKGILAASRSEKAFQQELVLFVLGVPLAFVIATDTWRRVALVAVLALLLVVELLNTAIEKLADEFTQETRPGIGRVKDMGSAAVGLSLLLAGLVWLVALGERVGLI